VFDCTVANDWWSPSMEIPHSILQNEAYEEFCIYFPPDFLRAFAMDATVSIDAPGAHASIFWSLLHPIFEQYSRSMMQYLQRLAKIISLRIENIN
jgi:hypothetical protein